MEAKFEGITGEQVIAKSLHELPCLPKGKMNL
ncbi:hypothetical protein ACT7DH_14515 [Bacillus pacificus]